MYREKTEEDYAKQVINIWDGIKDLSFKEQLGFFVVGWKIAQKSNIYILISILELCQKANYSISDPEIMKLMKISKEELDEIVNTLQEEMDKRSK